MFVNNILDCNYFYFSRWWILNFSKWNAFKIEWNEWNNNGMIKLFFFSVYFQDQIRSNQWNYVKINHSINSIVKRFQEVITDYLDF